MDFEKQWDFIINETHNGNKENIAERELLFTLECELGKTNPNMAFYQALKNIYIKNKTIINNNNLQY